MQICNKARGRTVSISKMLFHNKVLTTREDVFFNFDLVAKTYKSNPFNMADDMIINTKKLQI